jgi:hypothetical protein
MRINVLSAILITTVLMGSIIGMGPALAKMPANASTNPDVLKIQLNQSGLLSFLMIYHDVEAGYWDISYIGKQRKWNGEEEKAQGNVSFPDSEVNLFEVP